MKPIQKSIFPNAKSIDIGMKISISISDDFFKETDRIARESHSSRSQIFCQAVTEYLEKHRARKLFEKLNEAYKDREDTDEKRLRKKSIEYYRRKITREGSGD